MVGARKSRAERASDRADARCFAKSGSSSGSSASPTREVCSSGSRRASHRSLPSLRMSSRPTGSSPCMFPMNANEGLAETRPGSSEISRTRIGTPFPLAPMDVSAEVPAHGPRWRCSSAAATSSLERYRQALQSTAEDGTAARGSRRARPGARDDRAVPSSASDAAARATRVPGEATHGVATEARSATARTRARASRPERARRRGIAERARGCATALRGRAGGAPRGRDRGPIAARVAALRWIARCGDRSAGETVRF